VITARGTDELEEMFRDVVVASLVYNSRDLSHWTTELRKHAGIRWSLPLKHCAINRYTT
jgi:hypothetical protein